ncbi:MAG: hypothetical protein ACFFDN_51965, partial [Candidatus Hodarchaeota archaeon]
MKLKRFFFLILILLAFVLGFFSHVNYSKAQVEGESLAIKKDFQFLEYSRNIGAEFNSNSINITIPSSSWNISSIELNFTNIEIEKEIIEIETEDSGSKNLNKQKPGYAVQINVSETLIISAVEIFGYLGVPSTTTNITVQINGYEAGTNKPNNTIYGSTLLNISTNIGWYIQTFSSPVFLTPGNYFLVLNGTAMQGTADSGKYYWYFNNDNPNHPELYTSEYDTDWKDG